MSKLVGSVNKKNRAFTQFIGHDFNSICHINGRTFFANDDGLFEVRGGLDDTLEIDAYFDTVASGWGSLREKRLRFLLMGLKRDGAVAIDVIGDSDTIITTVNIDGENYLEYLASIVKSVERKATGKIFKFRVKNVDGSFFYMDQLHALFIERPHGIRRNI